MTELSLSAINASAPYLLRLSDLGGFDFDVDAGLTYNISLIRDYMFGEEFETYMLNLLPHSMDEFDRIKHDRNVKVRKDAKIKQTVIAVLKEAMKHKNLIIDYVCLSKDSRQGCRARLFETWFKGVADSSNYRLLTTSLMVENETNYLGAFLRRDNEQYESFCAAFRRFDDKIHKDEPWGIEVTEY
jgi:hypothetical protein